MILKQRLVNIDMRYIVQPANDMDDDDRWAGAILLRSHVAQPRGASLVLRVNATRHVTRVVLFAASWTFPFPPSSSRSWFQPSLCLERDT